jgi:hypothetical protein
MAQNKAVVVEQRRNEVIRLYLMGMAQIDIAVEVGVTPAQITNDIQRTRKRWLSENMEMMTEQKGQELAKLDLLEAEAWDAWQNSKKPIKKKHTEHYRKKLTLEKETEVTTVGDPRFLSQIESCIKGRCQLLGLTDTAITINNVNISPIEWVGSK